MVIASTFLLLGSARGSEHAAIIEVGAAIEREARESAQAGPTLAVEVTPIEDLLELEFGVTRSTSHIHPEWETDLLFKKPYTLSSKVEFMAGLGPSWTHSQESAKDANSIAAEFVLDFMFWPAEHWGWYLEPGYSYGFDSAHRRAVGVSIGLLFGIR